MLVRGMECTSRHSGSFANVAGAFCLIRSMSGSDHYDKLFWFVLAYALSGASYLPIGSPKRAQAYAARSNSSRKPAQLHRPPEVAS